MEWYPGNGILPGGVIFDTPESPTTTATFSVPGAYVLRLTASDGVLAASDEVVIFFESASTLSDLVVPLVDVTGVVVDHRTLEVGGQAVVEVENAGLGTCGSPKRQRRPNWASL